MPIHNPNQAHVEGRFALREDVRRVMREGIESDTSLVAADLMREVVQWASTHPLNYLALLEFVNQPRFQPTKEATQAKEGSC